MMFDKAADISEIAYHIAVLDGAGGSGQGKAVYRGSGAEEGGEEPRKSLAGFVTPLHDVAAVDGVSI